MCPTLGRFRPTLGVPLRDGFVPFWDRFPRFKILIEGLCAVPVVDNYALVNHLCSDRTDMVFRNSGPLVNQGRSDWMIGVCVVPVIAPSLTPVDASYL